MRQEDGPSGERALELGIRSHVFRQLAAEGFDRSSDEGACGWAAGLTAHNALLRGGEVCRVEGKPLDPVRDFTCDAIEFRAPCRESRGRPWLTFDTVPIKDTTARRRVCPMAIMRRHEGLLGADPLCTYDAIVVWWVRRTGAMPSVGRIGEGGTFYRLPFFIGPSGEAWDTGDTRALARRMAVAVGIPSEQVGARSFRIGGATDLRARHGQAGIVLIKERGRWASDVGLVYQRALVSTHLEASVSIGEAWGAEFEAVCPGWVQPANFR